MDLTVALVVEEVGLMEIFSMNLGDFSSCFWLNAGSIDVDFFIEVQLAKNKMDPAKKI